ISYLCLFVSFLTSLKTTNGFQGKKVQFISESISFSFFHTLTSSKERGNDPHWEAGVISALSISYHTEHPPSLRPLCCVIRCHPDSKTQLCDDVPSLQALGWPSAEVGSMKMLAGAKVSNEDPPDMFSHWTVSEHEYGMS
uniref:Uncharacterized protein n=1 Tax=Eptatretus burgeri TaxID=7764 RepID=A0A8C4QFK9_EPTBU